MKYIFLTISILVLSACGGGGDDTKNPEINNIPPEAGAYTLQNIRFDSKDYYEGEQITVTEGTNFEVRYVNNVHFKIIIYNFVTKGSEVSHGDAQWS